MYVTLSEDAETHKTEPIFFTKGLLKSKRDIKAHASNVAKDLGCIEEKCKVLSYKYSLDEFEDAIIARFGDADGHSIEIIKITTTDNGLIWSNKVREIKVIMRFYFVFVGQFEDKISSGVTKVENQTRMITRPSEGNMSGYDEVMKELSEKITPIYS